MTISGGGGTSSHRQALSPGIPGYVDAALIGEGGFARVYRSRQPAFNRLVAIKVLSKVGLNERALHRFDLERATVGSLSSHPNIVTVYDSGLTDEGVPYLTMEYVPGGSLGDRLAREGALAWAEVLHIGIRLAGALESAHRAGILHRDLKPENVLLSSFGEPQLSDFGIARLVAAPDTRTAERNLSVAHAAPEVLNGERFSARSDVYSLASTLFALLWGRPPFVADDDELVLSVVMRITREPPPDLRSRGVPEHVCRALERALAKQPAERQATALALADDFREAQATLGLPPTTPLVIAERGGPAGTDPAPAPHMVTTEPLRTTAQASPLSPVPKAFLRKRWPIVLAPLLLAAAVGAVLVATRSSDDDRAGPTATTTAPTPITSLAPAVPFPSGTSPAPPGTYVASRITPPFAFTLPEGWRSARGAALNYLDLVRAGGDPESIVTFVRVRQALDPNEAPTSAEQARAAMRPAPDGLLEWLQTHPRLRTTDPVPVTHGALTGMTLEATPIAPYDYPGCLIDPPKRPCVPLFESDDDSYVVSEGSRVRFSLLALGAETLVAVVEAPADRFDAFVAEAEQLLSTLVPR